MFDENTTQCLPCGREDQATMEEVLTALNEVTSTITIYNGDVDGLPYDPEWLNVYQNNEHHMEGWLYNHNLLIFRVLAEQDVSDDDRYLLERAVFWHDLGKYHTNKDSAKKVWEDGTPQSAAFGHEKKSAELLDEAMSVLTEEHQPDWFIPVQWLVLNHTKAHSLAEQCNALGRDVIPDWLKPQIDGLDPWNWPDWADLEIPHGANYGKKAYNWTNLGASRLLRVLEKCDAEGRIGTVRQ